MRTPLLLILLLFVPPPCFAGTIYVGTKDYQWQWGESPAGLDSGTDLTRGWLEKQRPPKLLDATPAIKRLTVKYFKLEKDTNVKYAVLGAPRSTNGHDPHFFAWIEWVHKSKFIFDKDSSRWVRKAGVAKIAIEGAGESHLEMREWHYDKDLKDEDFSNFLPWDAAVITRKMLDFHAARPRGYRDKANGRGQSAPY
jgi:hypothetical protein